MTIEADQRMKENMFCLWFTTFLLIPALVFSQGSPHANSDGSASAACQPTDGTSVNITCVNTASFNQIVHDNLVKHIPAAMKKAVNNLRVKMRDEVEITINPSNTGEQAFTLVQRLQKGKPVVKQLEMQGFCMENCTHELLKLINMKAEKATMPLIQALKSPLSLNLQVLQPDEQPLRINTGSCPYTEYTCSIQKYRSFDGSCNNLQNPLWGRAMTPLKRYLPADYFNGIEEMRRAKDGSELPSARLVSTSLHTSTNRPDPMHTLMLMQWGQFLDHDFSLTALTKLATDIDGTQKTEKVYCGQDDCGTDHSSCKPIEIPRDDPVFESTKKCLEFVRSAGILNMNCKMGPREQLNQLTSFIDGSQIYGSSKEQADTLRDMTDPTRGRMKVSDNPNPNLKKLLPTSTEDEECVKRQQICYEAGDERVNEQTSLTTLHTVWMREHNRLEEELHQLNPLWDGERLYQECRKITGALIQQITYREFLPLVLGPIGMKKHGLELLEDGFYTGYDPSVDASIANIFATAAYRFGHSLITPMMKMFNKDFKNIRTFQFSELFFRPSHLLNASNDGVDGFLRGACTSGVQQADRFMTDEVTNKLFSEMPPGGLGTDLAAINIQRSRDHGIPGYNAWRTFCGLRKVDRFEDIVEMKACSRETFKRIYRSVDDIDIFSAGLAEIPSEGSLLGPTFSCILGKQFAHLRNGDRFWYENFGQFSAAQLKEIRRVKLSKIICDNGDNINKIQPAVFENPFREAFPCKHAFTGAHDGLKVEELQQLWNPRKHCDCLPGINFKDFNN